MCAEAMKAASPPPHAGCRFGTDECILSVSCKWYVYWGSGGMQWLDIFIQKNENYQMNMFRRKKVAYIQLKLDWNHSSIRGDSIKFQMNEFSKNFQVLTARNSFPPSWSILRASPRCETLKGSSAPNGRKHGHRYHFWPSGVYHDE